MPKEQENAASETETARRQEMRVDQNSTQFSVRTR
jgi:hypothetical protein